MGVEGGKGCRRHVLFENKKVLEANVMLKNKVLKANKKSTRSKCGIKKRTKRYWKQM